MGFSKHLPAELVLSPSDTKRRHRLVPCGLPPVAFPLPAVLSPGRDTTSCLSLTRTTQCFLCFGSVTPTAPRDSLPPAQIKEDQKAQVLESLRSPSWKERGQQRLASCPAFPSLCPDWPLPPKHILTSGAGILTGPDLCFSYILLFNFRGFFSHSL